jgi:hypothetical protein
MLELKFDNFDERLAFEAESRGYLGGARVKRRDGSEHPVFFYDAIRLAQDLEAEAALGRPFIAEKGMIILTKVTLENMQKAIEVLDRNGFFGPTLAD